MSRRPLTEEEDDRFGMVYLTDCPDCLHRLVSLTKLNEEGSPTMRVDMKVCVNPRCWRFTDPDKMSTWRRI